MNSAKVKEYLTQKAESRSMQLLFLEKLRLFLLFKIGLRPAQCLEIFK